MFKGAHAKCKVIFARALSELSADPNLDPDQAEKDRDATRAYGRLRKQRHAETDSSILSARIDTKNKLLASRSSYQAKSPVMATSA